MNTEYIKYTTAVLSNTCSDNLPAVLKIPESARVEKVQIWNSYENAI